MSLEGPGASWRRLGGVLGRLEASWERLGGVWEVCRGHYEAPRVVQKRPGGPLRRLRESGPKKLSIDDFFGVFFVHLRVSQIRILLQK